MGGLTYRVTVETENMNEAQPPTNRHQHRAGTRGGGVAD
jgi:hypothetical protein